MYNNNKWRKVISLVVAVCMLVATLPLTAFAVPEKKDTLNYVSLGDSMTNGYGLDGYLDKDGNDLGGYLQVVEGSYPDLFAKWLAEEFDCDVNIAQLAVSCTRAEDLAFILNYDGKFFPTSEEDMDQFAYGDAQTYNGFIDDRWEKAAKVSKLDAKTLKAIADKYQDSIKDADVVTMSIGNSNFGVIMLANILSEFGIPGYAKGDWIEIEDAYASLDSRLVRVAEKIKKIVNKVGTAIAPKLTARGFNAEQVETICEILSYTIVSYAVNYVECVDRIVELNPDVDLVIVGLMNNMAGVTLKMGDNELDVGELMDDIIQPLNAFLAGYPVFAQGVLQYQEAEFYFADVEDVESFTNNFAQTKKSDTVRERIVSDLCGYKLLEKAIITLVGGEKAFIKLVEDYEKAVNDSTALKNFYIGLAENKTYGAYASEIGTQIAMYAGFETLMTSAANSGIIDVDALFEIPAILAGGAAATFEDVIKDVEKAAVMLASSGDAANKEFVNQLTYDIATYYSDKAGVSFLGLLAAIQTPSGVKALDDAAAEAVKAIAAVSALKYLPSALMLTITEEKQPVLYTLMHMFARFIAANGIGSHPNAEGYKQILEAIKEVYPSTPAKYTFAELSQELVITMIDYAGEYGIYAFGAAAKVAVTMNVITQAQFDKLVAAVQAIMAATEAGDQATALALTNELLAKVENFVKLHKDDIEAFLAPYATRLSSIIKRYIAIYGPKALAEVKVYLSKKNYLTFEQVQAFDAYINTLVEAANDENNEAIVLTCVQLAQFITKFASDRNFIDNGEGINANLAALEDILNYIKGMTPEEIVKAAATQVLEFIKANQVEALVVLTTFAVNQGWVPADQAEKLVEKVSGIMVAYKIGDEELVHDLVYDLVNMIFVDAVEAGCIDAKNAQEAQKLATFLHDAFHFFNDTDAEQKKALAIKYIYQVIDGQFGQFTTKSEAKAYTVTALNALIANKGVEALVGLEQYLYENGLFSADKHAILKAAGLEIQAAYKVDPAQADALLQSLVDFLLQDLIAEGYVDEASIMEAQKLAIITKLACEFIAQADEYEIKQAAIQTIFAILDTHVATKIDEDILEVLKFDIYFAIMAINKATPDEYLELVKTVLPAEFQVIYLQKLYEATQTDFYYPDEDSFYLALGGETTGGYGITRDELTYAQIFAEEFDVASKSVGSKTPQELLTWVLQNPGLVAKADFITVQADSTDIIKSVLNGEDPEWSTVFSDAELAFVKAAIPVIKQILAQDWAKYADMTPAEIYTHIEKKVFDMINAEVLKALQPINNNLTTLFDLCIAEVKNYLEYAQYEAIVQLGIPTLKEIGFVFKIFETVSDFANQDWEVYKDLAAGQIVELVTDNVLAVLNKVDGFEDFSNEDIKGYIRQAAEQVANLNGIAKEQIAKLPNYVENDYVLVAAAAFPVIFNYIVAKGYDASDLGDDAVNSKFVTNVIAYLGEDSVFGNAEFFALGEKTIRHIVAACVELSIEGVYKFKDAFGPLYRGLEAQHLKFAQTVVPFIIEYLFKLDWAEKFEEDVNTVVEELDKAVTAKLLEQSDFAKEYVREYLSSYKDIYEQIVLHIENIVKTQNALKNKMVEILAGLDTYMPYIEKFAYANISEAYAMIKLVSAIKMINPDAELLVLGMYNQFDGIKVVKDGSTLDLGKYTDYYINTMNFFYANVAMVSQMFTYVPLNGTPINGANRVINIDEVSPESIGLIIIGLYDDMFANAEEGHPYIYSCIFDCITTWVEGVYLDTNYETVEVGDVIELDAYISPDDATFPEVKWTSSDESIATVDENGVVTTKKIGRVEITVEAVDNHYGTFTDTCVIYVFPATDNKTKLTQGEYDADVDYIVKPDGKVYAIVQNELACVVIAREGDKLTKLTGTYDDYDAYVYDLSAFEGEVEIVVAIRGDYNLDGKLTTIDVAQANKAFVEDNGIDPLKELIFDISGDDKITTNDIAYVNKKIVDGVALSWN